MGDVLPGPTWGDSVALDWVPAGPSLYLRIQSRGPWLSLGSGSHPWPWEPRDIRSPVEGVHTAGHSSAGALLAGPALPGWPHPFLGCSLLSPPHCSVLVRPGAAVGPGGGQAAQERQRGHPRVRPRRPLQAGAVSPIHGLLLVRPGGHRPPHPRHVHQVSSGMQASLPPWTQGPEARPHPCFSAHVNTRGGKAGDDRPPDRTGAGCFRQGVLSPLFTQPVIVEDGSEVRAGWASLVPGFGEGAGCPDVCSPKVSVS